MSLMACALERASCEAARGPRPEGINQDRRYCEDSKPSNPTIEALEGSSSRCTQSEREDTLHACVREDKYTLSRSSGQAKACGNKIPRMLDVSTALRNGFRVNLRRLGSQDVGSAKQCMDTSMCERSRSRRYLDVYGRSGRTTSGATADTK